MSLNLGLNVVEVDGRAAPSIQPAPTSVTGFVIRSQRGIAGQVIQVTNWSQFVEHFGSYRADAYGAYAVRGFFDNGGSTGYITRVSNTKPGSPTAASIISSPGPWQLIDKSKLTLLKDGKAIPEATFSASSAILDGSKGTSFDLSDGANGKQITIKVNGIEHGPYPFDPKDFANGLVAATAGEVAAVLTREFPGIGIQILADSDQVHIRTDKQGTGATLEASGSAVSVLGLLNATGSGNVADIKSVTAEEAFTILNKELTGITVTREGTSVKIAHPNPGTASKIQITEAPAPFGFDTVEHFGTDGSEAIAAAAAQKFLSSTSNVALTVAAGYRGKPDVGAWGDELTIKITTNTEDTTLFDLIVSYKDKNNVVETWSALSMTATAANFVESVINNEFAGSKYIVVKATGTTNPAVTTAAINLAQGNDGAFADPSTELIAYADAIDLYDVIDIQLLVCPEAHDGVVVKKALTHCKSKGDRMFVGHTPFNHEMGAAKTFGKEFQGNKVYGALYFPWIRVADPLGGQKWIPPTGHITGVYARTEGQRGIWKAPAGNAAILNGALDVRYQINDTDHTDLVKSGSVNAVRFIPGQGIVIDSSRTLSTNPLWLYVNIRLLFNFVESSLKSGLRWVVQEPNDYTLWNKVKFNSVTPFLMGLWRRGAFGPGAPEDVFTVKIDEENNPPANLQQGLLTIEVYFYPSRPAETIVIIVGQQEGGATAKEGG